MAYNIIYASEVVGWAALISTGLLSRSLLLSENNKTMKYGNFPLDLLSLDPTFLYRGILVLNLAHFQRYNPKIKIQ